MFSNLPTWVLNSQLYLLKDEELSSCPELTKSQLETRMIFLVCCNDPLMVMTIFGERFLQAPTKVLQLGGNRNVFTREGKASSLFTTV